VTLSLSVLCCVLHSGGMRAVYIVNCGRPDVDYNGVAYGTDWWVGSVVRYECRSGFLPVGEPTRVCQSSGLWTPKPTCLREYTHTSDFLPFLFEYIYIYIYILWQTAGRQERQSN